MNTVLDRTTNSRRDQARGLRALLDRQQADSAFGSARIACRTIAITSGKGGVGKSHIALNLAVVLAQSGRRVCLVDANMGLGNLDLLCGLNGYWNLSHVVTGARSLQDVILTGPAGIHLIPGGSGISQLADCPPHVQRQLLQELHSLESEHDVLLIDTGSGIHQLVRQFALCADDVLVVTTPEATAIADAYATIKVVSGQLSVVSGGKRESPRLGVIINQAGSASQANQILDRIERTARMFLGVRVESGGSIPRDPAVVAAVMRQQPFVESAPNSNAARAVKQLAGRLLGTATTTRGQSFFARLWRQLEHGAA